MRFIFIETYFYKDSQLCNALHSQTFEPTHTQDPPKPRTHVTPAIKQTPGNSFADFFFVRIGKHIDISGR